MASTTTSGIINSFGNTPQANADFYSYIEGGTAILLDVMANDLGGNAKTLWSITDETGETDGAVDSDGDGVIETSEVQELLVRDLAGAEQKSALGATIKIVQ